MFAKKKIAQTDEIFAQLSRSHRCALGEESVLRLCMDAKATVKIGEYSRGGKNRVQVFAADHDFQPETLLTPVGILVPHHDALWLYGVTSKVTSDCLADIICHWWSDNESSFPKVKKLLLNLDNGPECHSRRTQFLFRLIDFVSTTGISIDLAYYPPYHSKYNPIERCWGVLENHWNGDLLDSVATALSFARSMTWKGKHAVVELITDTYHTGVSLSQKVMARLETQVRRLPGLEKWFVHISPATVAIGTF